MVNCLLGKICKNKGVVDVCNDACINKKEFEFLINNSEVPKRYYNTTLTPPEIDKDVFEDLKKIRKNILDLKENVYIYSTGVGNGKTSWACRILFTYCVKIHFGNNFKTKALFLNVTDFLNLCKENITRPNNAYELKEKSKKVDLLIMDDLIITRSSDYDTNVLYDIINYRYNNMLPIIFTSNQTPENLKNVLDKRLTSRVLCGKIFNIKGGDKRNASTETIK